MNYVFDANLKDDKWLYILQGHFLKRLKIIANLSKINILHSWPWIFMNDLNIEYNFYNQSLGDGHSDKVYETPKGRSLLNLCIMHPIAILVIFISTEYPGDSPGWKFCLSSRETYNPVC